MKKIAPIIMIIAIFLGMKANNKSKASKEIKAKATAEMQSEYSSVLGSEYVIELVDYAHPSAMDAAYNLGGKRKSAIFDANTYGRILHQKMEEKMRKDGKGGGGLSGNSYWR